MKVLITGIGGRIGRALADGLCSEHSLRGLSLEQDWHMEGVEYLSGSVTDRTLVDQAVEGIETVIHLAGDPRPEAPWASILSKNIDGTYQVVDAAHKAGVRRVIYASSNHITGGYTDNWIPMTADMPVTPDSLYGVSKAFGESLGQYYSQYHGLSFISLRIGNYNEENHPKVPIPLSEVDPRQLVLMWISRRDLIQLFRKAMDVRDLPFGIFYGTSGNKGGIWDLTRARSELGYDPEDDSTIYPDYPLQPGH